VPVYKFSLILRVRTFEHPQISVIPPTSTNIFQYTVIRKPLYLELRGKYSSLCALLPRYAHSSVRASQYLHELYSLEDITKTVRNQITETMQNVFLQPESCELHESVATGGR